MKMKDSLEMLGKIAGLAALIIAFYVSFSLILWTLNERFRDHAIFFWSIFILVITCAGTVGGLKNQPKLVWAAGFILTVFSILAMFSIGNLTLPIAVLMLISAFLLSLGNKLNRKSANRM